MPTSSSLRFGCLALAIFVLAPMASRAGLPYSTQVAVLRWQKDLEKADAFLRTGEWQKGEKAADGVVAAIVAHPTLPAKETAALLASALRLRGLGRIGQGQRDAGVWDLEMVWNLDPGGPGLDLSPYRLESESLVSELACYRARLEELWHLPAVAGAPPCRKIPTEGGRVVEEPMQVGGEVSRPQKIAGRMLAFFPAHLVGSVKAELLIDEKGCARHPVILEGFRPLMVYTTLESMRDWKFRPAQLAGKPVPVYYRLTTTYR